MRSPLPRPGVVARSLRRAWPEAPSGRVRVVETGWTNLVLEVDRSWIVRVPRWEVAAQKLATEVRLLDFLGDRLRARIPSPEVVGSLDEPKDWPFVAYRAIPGRPLRSLRSLDRAARVRLSAFLARLFEDFDRLPTGDVIRLGLRLEDPPALVRAYARLRRRYRRVARSRLEAGLRSSVDRAFDEMDRCLAASRFRPVFSHNDLWPNHLVWDSTNDRPVGVIDWEDARVGDPATDLVTFTDLDPDLQERLARTRRRAGDQAFDARLAHYRQLVRLHGVLFGLETGHPRLARREIQRLRAALRVQPG